MLDDRDYEERVPATSSYEMSPEIRDWLLHELPFLPFERSVFVYFRGVKMLGKIVTDVQAGLCPKIEADMAIRAYNDDNDTRFSYEDIAFAIRTTNVLDMGNHIYSPVGEWAVYTDQPNLVLLGEYDDPVEAFENAHPDVEWLLLEIPERRDSDTGEDLPAELLVFRSPWTGHREESPGDENLAFGLYGGGREAYVIPPEIEAAVGTCPDLLEMQCTTSTR